MRHQWAGEMSLTLKWLLVVVGWSVTIQIEPAGAVDEDGHEDYQSGSDIAGNKRNYNGNARRGHEGNSDTIERTKHR